jgi:hypothetical protein
MDVIAGEGAAEGYEEVTLAPLPGEPLGARGRGVTVVRRRSARTTRRAVLYLLCLRDAFVPGDLARWYTDRGFHFFVADLRPLGQPRRPDPGRLAEALDEHFACLDIIAAQVRSTDRVETLVVCAHAEGTLIAALWCHARRGSMPADALILASPEFGSAGSWLARVADGGLNTLARRQAPLPAAARSRVRRGLDIGCPVLVICPPAGWDAAGCTWGLLAALTPHSAPTLRLGAHVTWLKLAGGLPGQALPDGPHRKRFFDELGRWLGAYLSGQVRDQLL